MPATHSLDPSSLLSFPCSIYAYIFLMPFLDQQSRPISGPPKPFVFPLITSLVGRVRANRFYSVLRERQLRMKSILPFPSCFLYIPTFRQADISQQLQLMSFRPYVLFERKNQSNFETCLRSDGLGVACFDPVSSLLHASPCIHVFTRLPLSHNSINYMISPPSFL
jgi:hypothetical protein